MKKLKLPLEMANGKQVRSLQELRDNWDLEKVLGYYLNGRLLTWLNDRYYSEEAEKIQQLGELGDTKDLLSKLCAVFEIQCQDSELINIDDIEKRNQKLEKLRLYTADDAILKNVDKVAFDQDELKNLLQAGEKQIYLFQSEFTIIGTDLNVDFIGLNDPMVNMDGETSVNKNCTFKDCEIVIHFNL